MSRKSKTKAAKEKAVATHSDPGISISGKRDCIFGLLLVLAVIAAYQPAWHAGFIWDDDSYVTENPLLSAPDGLKRIWFSFDSPSQYFPLTYTAFRLEYALWGLNPAGYHWVNILLHAVNSLLVWRLLSRLGLPGAWLGAAIWALHPVQVESVAWVTELKNVMMCFFFLLTLLAWIRFMEENSGRRWNFYALALGLFALAICSKTTACTLPAALLLILWLKDNAINRQRLVQIIPFILLGIGMGLVTIWWERYHVGTQGKLFAMGLIDRMLLANRAVWFYAAKLFWPVNLTFSYPRWIISAADSLAYVWPIATIGLGVAIYCARRFAGRNAEVAVVFYISTLCPMLGFIMLYTFFYSFVADHYQYVASIGLISLFSAGMVCLAHLFKRRSSWLEMVIVAGLLLALGTMSWRQARIYRSGETLWADTLQKNPRSWMAHNNLGNLLLQKGSVEEAITHFHEALQIKPDYTEAHNNLGYALFQKGGVDEAIVQFQQALQINPDYANAHNNLGLALLQQGKVEEALAQYHQALRINPADAEAHNNLGVVLFQKGNADEAILQYHQALQTKPEYAEAQNNFGSALLQKGRIDEAIIQYQQALQTKPDYAEANYNLGIALLQKGDVDEAVAHFQNALQINPDYAKAHYSLGTTLLQKGRMAEAIFHYQQALRIKPDYAQARNNLSWVLATAPQASLRNGNQAVELAQQANQITGGENPTILRILAAAYAESGRFGDAQQNAQKALDLARAVGQTNLVNQISGELKLYAAGLPFHQDGN